MSGTINVLAGGFQRTVINRQPVTGSDFATSPTDATATNSFNSSGAASSTGDAGFTWLTSGTAANVDIFVTGTGDTPAGSALDTWLNLGTTRTWSLQETGIGTKAFTGTWIMRDASSLVGFGGSTFTLDAEVAV